MDAWFEQQHWEWTLGLHTILLCTTFSLLRQTGVLFQYIASLREIVYNIIFNTGVLHGPYVRH